MKKSHYSCREFQKPSRRFKGEGGMIEDNFHDTDVFFQSGVVARIKEVKWHGKKGARGKKTDGNIIGNSYSTSRIGAGKREGLLGPGGWNREIRKPSRLIGAIGREGPPV